MVSSSADDGDIAAAQEYFGHGGQREGAAQQMVEFVRPLVDESDGSEEQLSNALNMGVLCWNIAVLPRTSRDRALRDAIDEFGATEKEREAFREVAELLIARHEQLFPELHESTGDQSGDEHGTRAADALASEAQKQGLGH